MTVDFNNVTYATFWDRFLSSLLDSIVQACALIPLAYLWVGAEAPQVFMNPQLNELPDVLLNYVLPLLYLLVFWKFRSATPGKIWMGIMIVDAKTGEPATLAKLLLRLLGYVVCVITLFLGFLWMLIDRRNRGLHDLIAGTVVIRIPAQPEPDTKHFMDR